MSVTIAASILTSDFSALREQLAAAERAGADWFHLDVMDGHFVDNISFGPAFCEAVRRSTKLPVDIHLMIERPDHYVARFTPSGDNITVHVEANHQVSRTLKAIREAGCTAGLALNPDTAFTAVEPHLHEIDLLLVMTVHPGFGGQKFRHDTLEKIAAAFEMREKRGLSYRIEVDGGINRETAPLVIEKGARVLVAGSAIFSAPDMASAIESLRDSKSRA